MLHSYLKGPHPDVSVDLGLLEVGAEPLVAGERQVVAGQHVQVGLPDPGHLSNGESMNKRPNVARSKLEFRRHFLPASSFHISNTLP